MTNHLEITDLMAENQKLREELSVYANQNTNLRNDIVLCGMARDSAMVKVEELRSALIQFIAACDTAPPTSLMAEISMASKAARDVLSRT